MVGKVDEDVVRLGGVEDLEAGGHQICPSLEDVDEVLRSDLLFRVVYNTTVVDILAKAFVGGGVVNLARELVLPVVSNVIIGERDDMVRVVPVLDESLVGVANVCLVPVVVELVRSCDEHCPVVGARKDSQESPQNEYGIHSSDFVSNNNNGAAGFAW